MKAVLTLLALGAARAQTQTFMGTAYLKTYTEDTKFGAAVGADGVYTPSSLTANVQMTYDPTAKETQFTKATLTVANFASTDIAKYGEPSQGKFSLCFYQYGGYRARTYSMGAAPITNGTFTGCFEPTSGASATISTATLTNSLHLLAGAGSLLGRGAALMKRSIAIIVYVRNNINGYTFKLQDAAGTQVGSAVTATQASQTVYLDFPAVPAATYTLVAEKNANDLGNYVFGSNEASPKGYYWKTYYFVDLDTTVEEGADPATRYSLPRLNENGEGPYNPWEITQANPTRVTFPPMHQTLAATGWTFPKTPTLTQAVDTKLLGVAAAGPIGEQSPGATGTNDATGDVSTGKILCAWDNLWNVKISVEECTERSLAGCVTKTTEDRWITRSIFGEALLQMKGGALQLQAQITGLQCEQGLTGKDCDHSFHFHPYGDISGADVKLLPSQGQAVAAVGANWNPASPPNMGTALLNGYTTPPLVLPTDGSGTVYATMTLPAGTSLEGVLGRSLTIHDGKDPTTPTIAWAVCGVAKATACMRYECGDLEYEKPQPKASSAAALAPWSCVLNAVALAALALVAGH